MTELQPDFVDKLLFVQQNHDRVTIKNWILANKDIGVGDDVAEDEGRDVIILDTVGSQDSLPGPSQSTSKHQHPSQIKLKILTVNIDYQWTVIFFII